MQKEFLTITLVFSFLVVFGTAFFFPIPTASAQINTTSNVTIDITISEVAEVTVTPTNYTIGAAAPGADSSEINFSIKNTGSTNITNIFANVNTISVESSNPEGTGVAANYAASGFVFIRNETETDWGHAGRLEWNLTTELGSEVLDLGANTVNFSRGWYRNGTNTFLWKIENGTNGTCNDTGATFVIKEAPENSTSGLERDFTSGASNSGSFDEATDSWGLLSLSGTVLNGYCVAASTACDKVFIYKYDKRPYTGENFDGCTNSGYVRSSILYPGESTAVYMLASIPEGTPYGAASTSKLVVSAT